jgi:2-polyprenyl-6-methoxyphenol hydroxylase-like FAD-dependent oxidoreductase
VTSSSLAVIERGSLDVGVVGAGTAGAATALALARAGHRVTIYERVAEPRPVGAGLVLQPTGLHALARLGLATRILAAGARLDRLHLVTRRGRTLADLRYAELEPRWHGLGIHRGVLFEALLDAVRAEPAISLRLGTEITATIPRGDRVVVRGVTEELGAHALVVVADGAGGALHHPTFRMRPYPWGALWLVRDDTVAPPAELHQVVDGARHLYGLLPTGTGPDGRRVLSLFWSLRVDDHAAWRARGLDAWRRDVVRFDPRAEALLADVHDLDEVLLARYRDVRLARWHDGRVIYLGDAGHAMSPQLGQGANLALWDAMILADLVTAHGADVPGALARYTAARRRHLGFYQWMTRALTPFFQSGSWLRGALRDLGMPLAHRLGPIRRRMVRTMCGIETGLVRAPLALPPAT